MMNESEMHGKLWHEQTYGQLNTQSQILVHDIEHVLFLEQWQLCQGPNRRQGKQ